MMRQVTLADTQAIAIGAGILGTGGGGSTYLNRLRLNRELRQAGTPVPVIQADDVPDDALVCAVGGMGAPTVSNEKLQEGQEIRRAVLALEEHLRQKITAIVIGEIGGGNALGPMITALQCGLPVVDGDGMGRAFPELDMDTFMIYGAAPAPFALADSHGNVAIFKRIGSAKQAEEFARSLTIEMGGSAGLVMPVMSGAELKATVIRDTLSLAKHLGQAVLDCRARGIEPAKTVAAHCKGKVLFRGKIVDVERRTVQGFARGKLVVSAFDRFDQQLKIEFQNENLIARDNGAVCCTVPDLITLVTLEDGEPIGTEALRYGLRVAVLAMPAPRELKTPEALAVVGPRAFGYDLDFHPLPGDLL
ncbi:MAG: DUF917 domain-containing protein [Chloroflexi bacterium]|nr:DUF917 domain-containing protein [Chloroflexota bacterium]